MKLFKLMIILAAIILFVTSCANTVTPNNSNVVNPTVNTVNVASSVQTSPADAEFAAAKIIYDQKCVKCHLESGEGGQVKIDTVTLKVPNFRDPRPQDDDDADYIEKVEKGASGKMPAFKNKLTDTEIKSVVGYIRHEFQGK